MRTRKLGGLVVAVIAAVTSGPAAPSTAEAGTYRAAACEREIGAFMPETASFAQSTQGSNWQGISCSNSALQVLQSYLFVGARGGSWAASSGDHAEWTITAPAGLRFRGGWFQAFPNGAGGVRSQYRYRVEGQAQAVPFQPIAAAGWYNWPPASTDDIAIDQLILRAYCAESSCYHDSSGGNPVPGLQARYLVFEIEDYAQPAVGVPGGALMEGSAQRGTQLLAIPATDAGSGIAEVDVRVNDKRYASQDPGCELAPDGRALRLAPCPISPTMQLPIDTTGPPFAEGENTIEVCVRDYAQRDNDPASPGESCLPAGVYVDNSCPVSQGPAAADLRFGFDRRSKARMTVRYGKRARAVAKLTGGAREPIEGATVCVTSRDRVAGAAEVDVAEAQTNKRGKAKVKLPNGASRRVKLTYWADHERVENKTLRLNVRARPRLRVLSRRKLSDGAKARFRVKLAGPYRRQRKVAVQALAPAGWLDFPGCVGKTNRKGIFRCSYRFREQSGPLKYTFRALAPRQSGYPYLQGRTRSKTIVVRD